MSFLGAMDHLRFGFLGVKGAVSSFTWFDSLRQDSLERALVPAATFGADHFLNLGLAAVEQATFYIQ